MSEIKYTVRIDMQRVIAWVVERSREGHGLIMHPVTLSLDPRDHRSDGGYVLLDEEYDGISPEHVLTVVPATATMQAFLVLQANGRDCYIPPLNTQRADYPAGFFTQGAADSAEYHAWLEGERSRLEEEQEEQFGWYFRRLEAVRNRKER